MCHYNDVCEWIEDSVYYWYYPTWEALADDCAGEFGYRMAPEWMDDLAYNYWNDTFYYYW